MLCSRRLTGTLTLKPGTGEPSGTTATTRHGTVSGPEVKYFVAFYRDVLSMQTTGFLLQFYQFLYIFIFDQQCPICLFYTHC